MASRTRRATQLRGLTSPRLRRWHRNPPATRSPRPSPSDTNEAPQAPSGGARTSIEDALPLAAAVTSLVSLLLATTMSVQSLQIAQQSLETSRQSNDIAMGAVRILPQIRVSPAVLTLDFASADQMIDDSASQPSITVLNNGRVPISELALDISATNEMVYSVDDPLENFLSIPSARERIRLSDQLIPEGIARLRIKPCLLSYIDNSRLPYRNHDRKYRFVTHIVVLPMRAGDTLPPPRGGEDSSFVLVDYIPRHLVDTDAQSYLKAEKCTAQVFR